MPSTTDSPANRAKREQHYADHQEQDPQYVEDRDLGYQPDDQQDDAERDQLTFPPLRWT